MRFLRRLLRLPLRLAWLGIWHGVYYFLKRPVRLFYLAGILLGGLLVLFSMQTPKTPDLADVPATSQTIQTPAQVTQLPKIQGRIRNANSAFTKTLLATMPPTDLQTYSTNFIHAMNHTHAGQPYRWLVSDLLFGEIIPDAPFQAKSGVYCRKFRELISYQRQHERYKGMSCQRKSGGWCRLRPNSTPSCEIGSPNRFRVFLKNLL